MMDLVVRAPRLPVLGESLLGHSFQTFAGGKGGNQAVAAARLGADVAMVGKTGADRFGEILRNGLQSEGIDISCVSIDPGVGTGVAVPIVLDGGGNAIFAIPQANLELTAADVEPARAAIQSAGMLMVQCEVGMPATIAAMHIAKASGVPVMLNPAPIVAFPAEMLDLADVIVPNEVEAAALAPEAGGDHLRELATLRSRVGRVVITLGEAGAVLDDGTGVTSVGPFGATAVDSVGAGDAFCGALAVALCEGRTLAEAVRFGNAAGALATTKAGAQASLPRRADVDALFGGEGGTFRGLSASRVEDADRRTDTASAPGLAH